LLKLFKVHKVADMENPLRTYRKKTGRTLKELSAMIGLSIPQTSKIERFGTSRLVMAMKLSELTGEPASKFALNENAPKRRKAKTDVESV